VWANSPWRDGYTALWETPAALPVVAAAGGMAVPALI
jgi:Na+/H+ antiporter NhaA